MESLEGLTLHHLPVSGSRGCLKNEGTDLTEAEAGLDVDSGLCILAAFASDRFRESRIVIWAALIQILSVMALFLVRKVQG